MKNLNEWKYPSDINAWLDIIEVYRSKVDPWVKVNACLKTNLPGYFLDAAFWLCLAYSSFYLNILPNSQYQVWLVFKNRNKKTRYLNSLECSSSLKKLKLFCCVPITTDSLNNGNPIREDSSAPIQMTIPCDLLPNGRVDVEKER